MRYFTKAITALALSVAFCGCAPKCPISHSSPTLAVEVPGATVAFYKVRGDTPEQVRQQMNELGPIDFSGYVSDAAVYWRIKWYWPGYGTPTGDVSKATVTMRVMAVLPQWDIPHSVPQTVVNKWNHFLAGLAAHESQHVALVAAGRDEIETAIRTANSTNAETIATQIIQKVNRQDRDLDSRSKHGANYGLKFP